MARPRSAIAVSADEMRSNNLPIDVSLVETGNFVFPEGVACAERLLHVEAPADGDLRQQ